MAYRIGIDIGGTFTDFALFDEAGGAMSIHKRLTSADDPAAAVLDGLAEMLAKAGVAIAAVDAITHGTTLVTNAVIERKGAVTGMLTTAGFRDILDMGLEQRYDLFDLRLGFPEPLVPRYRRREVDERMRYDGTVERPLDLASARTAIADLVAQHDIKALAICLLHAYANPTHEQAICELAAAAFPDLHVSASAEVFAGMREFERWSTTVINAYTQPMFDSYIARLEAGVAALGFIGRLHVMTSSGGALAPDAARRFPVRALESGPAAGVLMTALHGRGLGLPELLSFDMGGTTAKGALVRDHQPLKRYDLEVARVHEFKQGSGLPVRIPAIDMIEIGAGGGSIAELDDRGLIRVGPRSAGADPGPACYGLGGIAATLTDANLLLGYLDPEFFLGGTMSLDPAAAARAIAGLADPLDLEPARAAWGIHEIINEDVARAFRIHASERGFDYRRSSMVCFGGSGPAHALAVAGKLRIPRVIFPPGAGVMSALGLLSSPLAFELARSRRLFVDELEADRFAAVFRPLEAEAAGYLERAGIGRAAIRIVHRLDMRYYGQGHEIEVTLPGPPAAVFAELAALFASRYRAVYAVDLLDQPLEIVNWKVEATGPEAGLGDGYRLVAAGQAAGPALKGRRRAYFPAAAGYIDCPVYDRYALEPGMTIDGPALVEERESTCLIGVGDCARVDQRWNLVAEVNGAGDAAQP